MLGVISSFADIQEQDFSQSYQRSPSISAAICQLGTLGQVYYKYALRGNS